MEKSKLKIKNDIFYLLILLLVTEFFNYISKYSHGVILFVLGGLGVILLETWFIRTFQLYSGKKISKYSDVIVKISLRERFFSYFIVPLIFYISLLAFLFFNKNQLMGYVVQGVCIILLMVLFLNVKSSLNKIYSIENATKAIFDFLCITILYLMANVYVRLGLDLIVFISILFLTVVILLLSVLRLHNKLGSIELLVSILSALSVVFFTSMFWNTNIFIIPAISALAFYLIISVWNIRFSGKVKLTEYFLPFLYVILALILIFAL